MLLHKQDLRCMNVVAHEGKLVIIATDTNGCLWYSVKQDGFESGYLNLDPSKRTGWEAFAPLEMANEEDDTSVVTREAVTFTREDIPGTYLLKSQYKSKALGAVAPAQLISADGHIYVFRQSKYNTLLCDRFVLDGLTNKLGRKLEVRFKRSRKRYAPFKAGKSVDVADTLDFRDANSVFFYEPTLELCLINGVTDGWFAVTRVGTSEHEQYRWHIFSYNTTTKKIEVASIRNSEEGLFDIRDQLVFDEPPAGGNALIPRSIPGILKRSITVPQAVITGGPAVTRYDLQEERSVANSPTKQLVRTTTRIMLAVPTDRGLASYSFEIAADGTLSEMTTLASTLVVRSDERDLMLPLDTLDQIKPIGAATPPPQGVITGISLGEGTDDVTGKIVVTSLEAGALASGDRVQIRGTKHYNGLYTITREDDGAFVITAPFVDNEIGVWEKHQDDEDAGLMFDGMISAYEKTNEGKLRVFARNHGLINGDLVQIVGTIGSDGEYPVTQANAEAFVIDQRWTAGEAINVKLLSAKRRGIVFDGQNDYIDLPPEAFPSGREVTICVWANGGNTLPKDATLLEGLDNQGRRVAFICLPAAAGGVFFDCGNGVDGVDRTGGGALPTDYKGRWTHWAFTKDAATNTMKIYRNGVEWKTGVGSRTIGEVARLRIGAMVDGQPPGTRQFYEGTLADLAIYNRALTADEVKNSIYMTLTGNESGLMGYWRLGAVVEAEARTVTDISTYGRNGTVVGGASCGGISLARKLQDATTLAVKYTNEEVIAVTQRATYIEELDFRVMAGGTPLTKAAVDNAGAGKPVFAFRYWGKRSRNAQDFIVPEQQPVTQPFVDLGGGWFRASCRFTIPDGMALLRSFEIADVQGTWDKIEINRHAIRIISDAITMSTSAESPALATLADTGATWTAKLKEIAANEIVEAQKLAQKLATEAKLTLLADAEYLRAERDSTAKEVENLTREVADLEARYRAADADPLNRYCSIRIAGTTNQYLHLEVSGYVVIWETPHEFEFVNWGNGRIGVKARGDNKWVYREYTGRLAHGVNSTQWMLSPSGGNMYIRDWSDGRSWHREGGTGKMILYTTGQAWEIVPGDPCNSNIATTKDAWDAKKRQLAERQARLAELNTLLDPNGTQKPVLEQRLSTLSSELVALQTTLATANAMYLNGVRTLQQGALSMPILSTDRRGLQTTGALLGFVMPSSRISMVETCEGNVLVSYQDADNRMRLTHYDATSDSRNTSYEQWITDAGRVCLSQTKAGAAVSLTKAVPMDTNWSAEAWVLTPLPTWEWTILAGTQDQKNAPLVVLGGTQLGLRSEGLFFASGFRFDTLTPGWHHVAAVKRADDKSTSVTFYVDGAAVGSAVTPAFSAVSLNGTSHGVDLQTVSLPIGNEMTVSFWARGGARVNPNAAAVVLEATDAQAKRILRISIPNSAGRIVWDCGADATTLDSLECAAQPSDYEGTWTHWTFTKNTTTGLMRIYRNGRLWARGTGRSKPITAATKMTIGKATAGDPLGFRGDIADVCVWNKELSATDILNGLGRPISIEDTRLAGYWKFEGTGDKAKAKDYSKAGKDGTLLMAPVILDVPAPNQMAIDRVGLATTTTPPPVPPAPMRGGSPVLFLDAGDDKVELPAAALPPGNAITIAFWTRAGSTMPRQNSLIEAINPNINANVRALGIHLPWSPEVVYFDCGVDAAGGDRIEKPITTAEYRGIWVHWAFTKNCTTGEMKIYRNGVLWQSGTGKTKPIPAATRIMLGCSVNITSQLYHGELTEFSIWNRALSDAEVTSLMGKTLRGDEPGLHGYWVFEAAQATDLTANRRNGTYFGNPVVTPPVPQQQSAFFDGTDDHVAVPEMNVDYSQGLSVEAWVFYDRYNNNARIVDFGGGQGLDNILLFNGGTSSSLRLSIFRGSTEKYLDASSILETGKWIHLAATVDAAGNAKIYKNGTQVASGVMQLPANVSRSRNYLGRSNGTGDAYFAGRMAEVRIWNRVRTQAEIQSLMGLRLSGQESGLVGYWSFNATQARDATAGAHHGVYTNGAKVDVVSAPTLALPPPVASTAFTPLPPFIPPLKLSEVRLWNTALSDDEIAVNSKTLLSGNEPNLIAYLPMNEATGSDARDVTGAGYSGTVDANVAIRWACAAPIGNLGSKRDSILTIEYSTVIFDPAVGRKTSIMRRFYGGAANDTILVLPDKRIEELDLVWIGNAQFAPTLLGYIEGAPPVPSENLTEDFSYNGATSVELVVSEELEFRWNQSENIGAGVSLDTFAGVDQEVAAGPLVALATAAKARAGYKGSLNVDWGWQRDTSISTKSTNRLTDRLELRGTPEQTPKFPHIGKRFIPKNVGYALVVSATADVFASKLKRSGKMIGYQITPVDGIPPDVNTITFLMNPAYVMAGSLDGLTGSRPTSDRFHRHVAAMRAQYGSMYPASYYRVKEAYALKQAIESEDKRREAFFAQFSTEDAGFAMNSQIDSGQVTQPVVPNQGGTVAADNKQEQSVTEQTEEVKKRQAMIQSTIGNSDQRAHADASFKAWQRRMERLQVLAGKRNIVNTYVWDADGGLRTEVQSFANTAEHTIGGSFSVDGGLGAELQGNIGGPAAELTVLVNGSLTQTASKTQSTTSGVELNVDLSGVEATGITNHDDMPIVPGEKVDRYRFMTFYLENSTKNFHDFWSQVVDPEWLQSNGEEARALRQAMGKANKTWRVLHRVTYVERPSLMGFGRDMRPTTGSETAELVTSYFANLEAKQRALLSRLNDVETKLDEIISSLRTTPNP